MWWEELSSINCDLYEYLKNCTSELGNVRNRTIHQYLSPLMAIE